MQNIKAAIEGAELVLRCKLDNAIGQTDRGTVVLAQTGYRESYQGVGFRLSVWAEKPASSPKGLHPISAEAQQLAQALLAKVTKK